MAQLKATGITGSLEVINEYITGSITGNDAKFTSITGSLQGNATTATTATTATVANAVENEITFNNSGTGGASGTTYDGTSETTISYNTLGAPKSDGTGASGTWGINITGNAATVTNGVTTSNISSYATTAVTAGTGLSGGGTVGALTLNLDFSELTDKTSDIAGTTEFILQDGTTESRKAASEIKLSFFNNDSGWTSNAGTVTSIATNNGITGGTITSAGTVGLTGQALALHNLSTNGLIARTGAGTVAGRTLSEGVGIDITNGDGVSGNPTVTLDLSEVPDVVATMVGTDEFIILDASSQGRKAANEIGLSIFNNDAGFGTGDITSVVAGNGLTGGATSGDATLTVGAGTGITVNANDVAVNTSTVPLLSSANVFTATQTAPTFSGSIGKYNSSHGVMLSHPDGALYHATSTSTGGIVISLPATGFMARFTIKIVEYSNNESFEVMCGGYYGSSWGNTSTFAYILGQPGIDRDFNVRFGRDGSTPIIIIGETGSQWSYLGVYVTEVEANGYSLDPLETWGSGWTIEQSTDYSGYTIDDTISGVQIGKSVSITTDNVTNNSGYIPMSLGTSTGATDLTVDVNFHFNPGTNILTSPNFAGNLAWSYITSTPTTVSGYGITDAVGTGANNTFTADNIFNNSISIGTSNYMSVGKGESATTHTYNVGIGYQVLNNANSSQYSVAIGYRSMFSATSANYTTAVGGYSLINLTNGTFNTAVGYQAGYSVTTGYRNVFLGPYAGFYGTGHNNNVAIGYYSMNGSLSTASPYRNVGVGTETLRDLTTGDSNVAMGYQAGLNVENGYGNTVIGYGAGDSLTSADYNTFVGRLAGEAVTTGNNNTIVGAGYSGTSTMTNTVVLADGSGNARLYIDSNGFAGFQTTTPGWAIEVDEDRASNPSAYFKNTNASGYGLYIAAGAQDGTSKRLIRFLDNGLNSIGDITHTNGAITYGAFTGNHPALVSDFGSTNYEYGTIVKIDSTQLLNNTQQPLFTVSKTTQAKQKSVFGVYASRDEEDEIHSIFALGDGHILVNAEGGDIEIGDYICSSNTAGIGMKQDDDLLHNYTVAKAAENVVWANEPEQTKLIVCTYHSA